MKTTLTGPFAARTTFCCILPADRVARVAQGS